MTAFFGVNQVKVPDSSVLILDPFGLHMRWAENEEFSPKIGTRQTDLGSGEDQIDQKTGTGHKQYIFDQSCTDQHNS